MTVVQWPLHEEKQFNSTLLQPLRIVVQPGGRVDAPHRPRTCRRGGLGGAPGYFPRRKFTDIRYVFLSTLVFGWNRPCMTCDFFR